MMVGLCGKWLICTNVYCSSDWLQRTGLCRLQSWTRQMFLFGFIYCSVYLLSKRTAASHSIYALLYVIPKHSNKL